MDPNLLLEAIRRRVDDALNDQDFSGIKLAELVRELDKSLSNEGFLPKAWDLAIAKWEVGIEE